MYTSCVLLSFSQHRMDSPEEMYQANVFIGDLAMHDSNRDFILAGTQQSPELALALNQVLVVSMLVRQH